MNVREFYAKDKDNKDKFKEEEVDNNNQHRIMEQTFNYGSKKFEIDTVADFLDE